MAEKEENEKQNREVVPESGTAASSARNSIENRTMKTTQLSITLLGLASNWLKMSVSSPKSTVFFVPEKPPPNDLYYEHKTLYGTQTKFDRSLTHVCHLLHCERDQLNVISSSKGLLMGDLILLPSDETVIDCRHQTLLIAESLTTSRPISTAKFILVIEKDATFQKLIDDQYFKQFPNSILVTGKGYPDICTRKFLRWLITILNIPIYGIFDADPHGTEIYLTYKYGSTSEKVEGRSAFVRNIRWLGVKPSEIVALGVDDSQFIPLLNRDYTKITRVLKRAKSLGEEDLVQELENLRKQKHKFEIEAISSMSADYFLLFYLKPKLEHL